MNYSALMSSAFVAFALLSSPASAENHVAAFGATVYGNEDCNNDADFLTENGIICTVVFSSTNVWDFLNNLQRRITLPELVGLNPALEIVDFETVIDGITFVRVR